MAGVNTQLLRSLAELWRVRSDVTVTIDSGRTRRFLHLSRGELIGADSDLQTERLGVHLVAEGLLDAVRVESLVAQSRTSGQYLGDLLVAQGLLGVEQMNAALEKQALQRFDRALTMPGEIHLAPRASVRVVVRRAVGPEIVRAFRERLPIAAASSLVATLMPRFDRMREDLLSAEALALTAPELRCFRQLASGQGAAAVLDRAPDYDAALRLIGALVGMGAVGSEEVDPVQEVLRTA